MNLKELLHLKFEEEEKKKKDGGRAISESGQKQNMVLVKAKKESVKFMEWV